MSTTNYFVSLHHLAGTAGHAATLALWHRLRQSAPVGHISLSEARQQAVRLRLPPDESLEAGEGVFWALDQDNERFFTYSAQRAAGHLAQQLGHDGILRSYNHLQVVVMDWRVRNQPRSYAGQLLDISIRPDNIINFDVSYYPMPSLSVSPEAFLPGDYGIAGRAGVSLMFRSAQVSRVNLAPAIPVIHLAAPEFVAITTDGNYDDLEPLRIGKQILPLS